MSDVFNPTANLLFLNAFDEYKRLLAHVKMQQDSCVFLDMRDVTICDSSAIALLIEAKKLSNACGKSLQILGFSEPLQLLIDFYGLKEI
jgi:ABC-type transporter Mla MlaB component